MVILHSYVSLPEGSCPNGPQLDQPSALGWFFRATQITDQPICRSSWISAWRSWDVPRALLEFTINERCLIWGNLFGPSFLAFLGSLLACFGKEKRMFDCSVCIHNIGESWAQKNQIDQLPGDPILVTSSLLHKATAQLIIWGVPNT